MSALKTLSILCLLFSLCLCQPAADTLSPPELRISEELFIDSVWAAHPVGFALLTHPPHQYVAYYDRQRSMSVAYRRLNQQQWQYQSLPETTGWDSHNYIRMALDEKGYLHLAGDMHVDTLKYYRSAKPYDIHSLQRVAQMTGDSESRVTYPEFFHNPEGKLVFTYRDGGSGQGNQIYNIYDAEQQQWQRLLDTQLVDGEGEMNAYLHGPVPGPDGYYHLLWVWRDTPDAATNHDLSYARSKDLLHWERSDGSPQPMPITYGNAEIIDPVPAGGGMINGNTVLGFDGQDRPIATYHKYDSLGHTQVYNARLEKDGWHIYQATRWDFRWEFGGYGSLKKEVAVSPVVAGADGRLTQQFHTDSLGSSRFVLHPQTLQQQQEIPVLPDAPHPLYTVQSGFPGMQVQLQKESTGNMQNSQWYVLRWETLGPNRDKPREGPLPVASPLMLYGVEMLP